MCLSQLYVNQYFSNRNKINFKSELFELSVPNSDFLMNNDNQCELTRIHHPKSLLFTILSSELRYENNS